MLIQTFKKLGDEMKEKEDKAKNEKLEQERIRKRKEYELKTMKMNDFNVFLVANRYKDDESELDSLDNGYFVHQSTQVLL